VPLHGGGGDIEWNGLSDAEEPGEFQQGQVQDPAPGEDQPNAPVQAGVDLLGSSSAERDWECWWMTG